MPLVPTGALIEVRMHDEEPAMVMLDGVAITDDLRSPLSRLIALSNTDRIDRSFATDRPQAVGDSWYPDLRAIAGSLGSEARITLTPERSNSVVTLRHRESRNGIRGALVEGSLAASDLAFPGLAERGSPRESRIAIRFGLFLPDDPAGPPLEDRVTMEMHLVFDATTPAGMATFSMDAATVRTRVITPN